MRIDRRKLYHLDWYLIFNGLALFAVGMVNLFSATSSLQSGSYNFFVKQLIAFIAGLVLIGAILSVDYRIIARHSKWFYIGTLVFIVIVLFVGMMAGGARRWISIFGISFQPSEFIKPVLVVFIAQMLYEKKRAQALLSVRDISVPIGLTLIPLALIMLQPDLGTAVIILIACLAILWFVGMKKSTYAVLIAVGTTLPLVLWKYALKPYQKMRVYSFLNLEADPQGVGYHTKQAMIAVGSGRFFGKGYMEGTQHKLQFIPEHHTDFIFTVFGEEWGFVGSIVLFLLFISFIHRALKVALNSNDDLGAIIAFGIASVLYFQFTINILMAIHLAPVVGIPLPFISYGGSSLVSVLASVGLLLNISMRRYMF